MAFIFGDSFDFYTTGASSSDLTSYGPWTSVVGTGLGGSATSRFSFGKSLSVSTINTYAIKNNIGNTSDTVLCAFAAFVATMSGSSSQYYHSIWFLQGGTASTNCHIAVHFRADGAIVVYRGGTIGSPGTGTLLATFTSAMTANSWQHFQIKLVINDTTGSIKIRKNGDTADTWSSTGLDTKNTTNAFCDSVAIGTGSASPLFDDFMLWDSSGSAPTDWVGDIRCYTLLPSADSTQKDFSASTGTDNYANVDDSGLNDGDTTYNFSSTVNASDLYEMGDLPTTPAQIHAVVVRSITRKSDAGARSGATVLKSGATTSTGTSTALGTSYGALITTYTTDPNTSAAWTASAVNALQVGVKVAA